MRLFSLGCSMIHRNHGACWCMLPLQSLYIVWCLSPHWPRFCHDTLFTRRDALRSAEKRPISTKGRRLQTPVRKGVPWWSITPSRPKQNTTTTGMGNGNKEYTSVMYSYWDIFLAWSTWIPSCCRFADSLKPLHILPWHLISRNLRVWSRHVHALSDVIVKWKGRPWRESREISWNSLRTIYEPIYVHLWLT